MREKSRPAEQEQSKGVWAGHRGADFRQAGPPAF